MVYWVSVYNSDRSPEHTIILNICLSGETTLENCQTIQTGYISIEDSHVPSVRVFPNRPVSTVYYQPVLGVKAVAGQ